MSKNKRSKKRERIPVIDTLIDLAGAMTLDYNLIPHNRLQRSTTLIGFIKAERKTLRSMTGKRTTLALNGLLFSFLSRLSKLNNARHDTPSFTLLVGNSILSPSSRTVNALSLVKSTTAYRG